MARYSIEEYVRWEDIDAAGIINYQAYLRFFGLAEVELFRSCGLSYKTLMDQLGLWLPRVHVECDYQKPLRFEDEVEVELTVREKREKSLVYDFVFRKILKDGIEEVARGSFTTVCVTLDQAAGMKAIPIPAWLASRITARDLI